MTARSSGRPGLAHGAVDVVVQVVRLHRRKKFHKARVMQLFRELRRSTASMPDGVVLRDQTEAPAYTPTRPNGAGCDPECQVALIRWSAS